jgi:hypothetical protein
MASMQSANAAILQVDTYLFINASPNPVGADQDVLVSVQLDKLSPTAVGAFGGDHFKGFTVKITKPDGSTETTDSYEAQATSGVFFTYTPTEVGTYSFQANFPGQWINTTATDYYFKPSQSQILEITVQEEPIPGYPDVPLPTDYWTRPIYGENKGWWQVADNWLMRRYDRMSRFFSGDTAFAPYTSGPNSPHVLWNKPIIFGGIGGGQFGDKIYYTGLSYEQFYNPLILEGRIIYTEHGPASYGDQNSGSIDPFGDKPWGTRCLDLYTGEEIWFLEDVNIMFAQVYDIENPNEHGLIAHLWEVSEPVNDLSTMKMYDAFTGEYILTLNNVPMQGVRPETVVFGPNGEILSYYLNSTGNYLLMWNSTKALGGFPHFYYPERYNIYSGGVINALRGVQWNVSIPDVPGKPIINIVNHEDGYILATWESVSNWSVFSEYPGVIVEVGYNSETGQQLWVQNRTNIAGRVFYSNNAGDGVYTRYDSPTMKIYGYSIKTGQQLWVTEPISNIGWAYFSYMHHIAYGRLYVQGYDGYIRAFNLTNGNLEWEYYFGSAGYETPYGTWPSYAGFNIADGKIYVTNDDHSPDSVIWRGAKLWVIDADTGELLWSISGMIRHGAISDGILTALNSLDGQVYTFGKGPSATTVIAPKTEITLGQKVMIEGTVTDLSPGQPGTPAVSDESMGAWMEYLHMQKPFPSNVTGVEVILSVLDSNNNSYEIGRATSDSSGTYHLWWKPEISGEYVITATFAGSNSYGSSFAQTAMGVVDAPPTAATPEPLTLPPTEMYIGVGTALMIVAIAIVGFLILRKR